jgi:hypothetical protein
MTSLIVTFIPSQKAKNAMIYAGLSSSMLITGFIPEDNFLY